jgi:hypothetical protein
MNIRIFTSILLSLAFLVVVVSGLVLWLSHSPQTFGIGKGVWKHAHIYVALLMTVAGVLHLAMNWTIYWSYLWEKAFRRMNHKPEIALSLLIVVAVAAMAAIGNHGGPMQSLGLMSLRQIAERAGMSADQLVAELKKQGIAVHDPADSLKEIAEHNKVSTDAVCTAVQKHLSPGRAAGPPHGRERD